MNKTALCVFLFCSTSSSLLAQPQYSFQLIEELLPSSYATVVDMAGDGTLLLLGTLEQTQAGERRGFLAGNLQTGFEEIRMLRGYTPTGINSSGTIIGNVLNDELQSASSFIRDPDGTYSDFVLPDANSLFISDINDRGDITGSFRREGSETRIGFIYEEADESVRLLGVEGRDLSLSMGAITESGTTAGRIKGGGFVIFEHGSIPEFQFPPCFRGNVLDYNDNGQMVLECFALLSNSGNLLYRDGNRELVSFPGAESTRISAVNNNGMLAGTAVFADGDRAFVAFESVPEPSFCNLHVMLGILTLRFLLTRRLATTLRQRIP